MKSVFNALRTVIAIEPGLIGSQIDYLVRAENACNLATNDFLSGRIDQETWLDTLEFFGRDMDDFVHTTEDNLMIIGF